MPSPADTVTTTAPVNERILDAALELFVEKGFHNVSVHEVQRRADVSIGSIYNHFGGKEGMARALYYHLLAEMQDLVESIRARELSAVARCNRLIECLFELTETRRSVIAFVLKTNHRQFLPQEPPICSAAPFLGMREIVQRGIRTGEIRDLDPWVASAAVFGPAIRLIHLRLDGLLPDPLPQYLDQTLESIWRSMAGMAPRRPVDAGTRLGAG